MPGRADRMLNPASGYIVCYHLA